MRAQPTCLGDENVPRNLARWSERLAKVLNGQVTFGTNMTNTEEGINMNVSKAVGTTPVTINTNFTVNHSLGRVPLTIVGYDLDKPGTLYRGTVAWTKTTVTLRSDASAANYNLILA